jgi:hypothetical protein
MMLIVYSTTCQTETVSADDTQGEGGGGGTGCGYNNADENEKSEDDVDALESMNATWSVMNVKCEIE